MRRQLNIKSLAGCAVLSSMLWPAATLADSRIVETWNNRPRFFTRAEGEPHSRFMTIVWYDRPRFFTVAPGEEHSRFHRLWYDRPRFLTRKVEYSTYGHVHDGDIILAGNAPCCLRKVAYTKCDTFSRRCRSCRLFFGRRDPCASLTSFCADAWCACSRKTGVASVAALEAPACSTNDSTASYSDQTMTDFRDSSRDSGYPKRPDGRFTLVHDVPANAIAVGWPEASRKAALEMQAKYGAPDSIGPDQLIWLDEDPWAEIVVFRDGSRHSFPDQHLDVLAQSVEIHADFDELSDFQGNVKVDHAKGLLTSTCKNEAMNILALNLAKEIIDGEKSVVEANDMLYRKARGSADDAYMQGLRFDEFGPNR